MSGRDPARAVTFLGGAAVALCLLADPRPAPAQGPAPPPPEGGWVGKRVVTQYGALLTDPRTGQVDDEGRSRSVATSGKDSAVFRTYKVEHVNGPWLWLKQEGGSAEGWVDARWVVPFDQAIDFYTAQIRANPSTANYIHRANVWGAKGEFDIAIADYGEAIRLDPKYAIAYVGRGIAWRAKGEHGKAIADYAEAIRLDPKPTWPYFGRAVVSLLIGRDGESDARAAIERDGWRGGLAPYAALIGHFAARRMKNDDAARRWLDDAAREANKDAWPNPVVRFLRHEIDEPALLALATDDGKRTEARCFLGLDHLLSGRVEPAREHFRWVQEHGVPSNTEYTIAVAELDRLEAKAKP